MKMKTGNVVKHTISGKRGLVETIGSHGANVLWFGEHNNESVSLKLLEVQVGIEALREGDRFTWEGKELEVIQIDREMVYGKTNGRFVIGRFEELKEGGAQILLKPAPFIPEEIKPDETWVKYWNKIVEVSDDGTSWHERTLVGVTLENRYHFKTQGKGNFLNARTCPKTFEGES